MSFGRVLADFRKLGPFWLSLVVALFCIMLIATLWATIEARAVSDRDEVLQSAIRQNANLAIAFEQYSLRILRNAEAVTQYIESAYLRHRSHGRSDSDLAAVLAERVAVNDFREVVAVFDARGQLVISSWPGTPAGVNIADREEFRAHLAGTASTLFVGKTTVTPLWNEAAIPITRRIRLAGDNFGGVVLVLVKPRRFTDFFEDAEVQPGDLFMLAGLDGISRARKIGDRETYGDDLTGSLLLAQRARQKNGSYQGRERPGEATRISSYRTLKAYPLVTVVGSNEDEVLAGYFRRLSTYQNGAAAVSGFILLFALLVIAAVFRGAHITGVLADSDARLRALIELSADWWWEQDAQFRFTTLAGMATTHGHIDRNDFVGRCRWEVPALKPLNTTWEVHRSVLEARLPFSDLMLEFTSSGGSVCIETIAGRPVFDAQNNFLGYRGIGTDVTDKIETERALRESEGRFRNLVELSSDWYWEQDSQFRYTFLSLGRNPAFDINKTAAIGKTRWELGVEGPTEEQWAEHRRLLDAHLPFRNFEHARNLADGSWFCVSVSGDPVFDEENRFTGYRGASTDITSRKRTEAEMLALNASLEEHVQQRTEQLEAANQELRAFAYSVAHDMRAPLRAIGGFSQMLMDRHATEIDPAGKALFTRILTNVEWMGNLIDGLLALSQLSMAPVIREAIDLSQLSQEIFDELRDLEPGRRVELVIAPGMVIEGDKTMVRRMMQNLISNAWKYSAKVPLTKIEIGVHIDGDGTPIFFIKDNGAGFDMQYSTKLFQAFQRLHSPNEFQGTGIGLAIVNRIVRKHGGRIRAEAEVGHGATFYFTFWRETPT